MKKTTFLMFCCFQALFATDSLELYFSYLSQLAKPEGVFQEGEIQVVTDISQITRIQKVQEDRLLKKGFSEAQAAEYSRIGVISEDHYWIWLRDAVYFPKGAVGTYDRLIWKSEMSNPFAGVVVLPVLPSGKIVLNLNYRHATRSWELELPRGGVDSKESIESAALREVKEETGLVASSLDFLGYMAPDTGALSSVVPVFLGKIDSQEVSNPEYSEVIAGIVSFTRSELNKGLVDGFLDVTVEGKKRKVPLRDSFLAFALLQAHLRGLL